MTPAGLRAAGASDVGRQRVVNEDRFHVDLGRGVFIVVDGVGGQAAGEVAAETAVNALVERLSRQTGAVCDRVREAITIANNEVHRLASTRADWRGMACVLTVAVVEQGHVVVGHVGDSRLYVLQGSQIEKITPDHSPIGEREDAREISERDAMRHPRRNEVYRDVGSEPRTLDDADFLFLTEFDLPADAALLICSDGLTDLVPSEAIRQVASAQAGAPDQVVAQLIAAANQAGGKDNITVVYVEGAQVVPAISARSGSPAGRGDATTSRRLAALGIAITAIGALAAGFAWRQGWWPAADVGSVLGPAAGGAVVVRANESIMAAMAQASAGTTVIVEPGEYRERLTLKDHVRVISRVPRGATLRLPADAGEGDALVMAVGATNAELAGFRIVGDSASALGVGVLVRDASVRLVDLAVSGAATSAFDLGLGDGVVLIGSDVSDNPGAALTLRAGSTARIAHNTFARNATSARAQAPVIVEPHAAPQWSKNVFHAMEPQAIVGLEESARVSIAQDNWFIAARPVPAPVSTTPRRGRGR